MPFDLQRSPSSIHFMLKEITGPNHNFYEQLCQTSEQTARQSKARHKIKNTRLKYVGLLMFQLKLLM